MRLKTLFVRFYKSFNYDFLKVKDKRAKKKDWEDIDEKWYPYLQIPIEPKVTTIVGANESGKSHLLTAIEKAISGKDYNDNEIYRDDFCRYSRFFAIREGELKFPDFGCEFDNLSVKEQQQIQSISEIPKGTQFDSFFLFRTNKDSLTIYLQENKDKYTRYLVEQKNVEKITNFLPHTFRIHSDIDLPDTVPIKQLLKRANNPKGTRFEFLEREQRNIIRELLNELYDNKGGLPKNPSALNQPDSKLQQTISSLIKNLEDNNWIYGKDPKKREKQFDLAYKLICKVAKIDHEILSDLADAMLEGKQGYTEALLKMINNYLSDSLNFPSYWVQDRKFSLRLSARDHDLIFTIRDRTGTDYSFSERSNGLKYFLSYYIQFLTHDYKESSSQILLMDEPDTYLSSQAQQDLMKIFDKFSNPEDFRHPVQVVYVTHSPFLIDKNHAERIRLLEKGSDDEGTWVVKSAAKNLYEPLRSGLGAFVGEMAFIGNCNLIVEGQTDQIILAGAARYLRSCGVSERETIDLNHVTIVPAGGAPNVPYIVFLACGRDVEKPAVIVLLDSDQTGDDAKKNLKKGGPRHRELLKDKFILQIGDLAGESGLSLPSGIKPTVIEDLIPLSICAKACQDYATQICGAKNDDIAAITEDAIKKKLIDSKTVFDAVQACCQDILKGSVKIEKVGFSRSVIEVIYTLSKEYSHTKQSDNALQEFENNFKLLFRRIERMQREAENERKEKRLSQKIDDVIQQFIKDHPHSARREDAIARLEDIESRLDDSLESDPIKSAIQDIRRDYKLDIEMTKTIDNYEKFKEDLEKIKYAGKLASQKQEEEE
ncbi:ATP-dependent nuclease [Tolypothrix sp. VBCCA 56010]|uniref:AAA family ATPase n=1 Tax=Tolypothrix sp. VBCCA 56010 TaxID=3137731 RepID=UPI003D7F1817